MMPDNTNDTRTMIASPLSALLKSRKAVTALITAGVNLVVVFAPGLEAHRAELLAFSMALWTVLASVLMNAIAKEDAQQKGAPTTINAPAAGDTNISQPAAPPADEHDTQPLNPFSSTLPHR